MIYGYSACRICDPGRAAVEQGLGLAIVAGDDSHLPLLLRRGGRRPCVRTLDHHHCECARQSRVSPITSWALINN